MEINGLKRENFTSDADFIQALLDAEQGAHVCLPSGTFMIDKPIVITNGASLEMKANTLLVATAKMDYVVSYIEHGGEWTAAGRTNYPGLDAASRAVGHFVPNTSKRIMGGIIDGAGLAGCLFVSNFRHLKVSDMTLLNPKTYGLYVNYGVELVAYNVFIQTTISGLAGNVGVYANGGDNHYEDIVVIDCTTGIFMDNYDAGGNRLFRCHVWGGPMPALPGETDREYLKDSIGFKLVSGENVLRDCYADTSKIGYDVHNWQRLIGCTYYNNYGPFKLDDVIIINKHTDDPLLVTNCFLKKTSPLCTLIAGDKSNLIWHDNLLFEMDQPVENAGGISFYVPEGEEDTAVGH